MKKTKGKTEPIEAKKVVRVGMTIKHHEEMEQYQKYFAMIWGRKISKADIIVGVFSGDIGTPISEEIKIMKAKL